MSMELTLDCSGRVFRLTKAVVQRIPYLWHQVSDIDHDWSKPLSMDFSPTVFEEVLAWLLFPLHPFPLRYAYALDFLDVAYEPKQLYDDRQALQHLDARLGKLEPIINSTWDGVENLALHCSGTKYCMKPKCGRSTEGNFDAWCRNCRPLCKVGSCETKVTNTNTCEVHRKIGRLCNSINCPYYRMTDREHCFLHCDAPV